MRCFRWLFVAAAAVVVSAALQLSAADKDKDKDKDKGRSEGFTPLFNGRDLNAWRLPKGDGDHWKIREGLLDYDAQSKAKGEKHLWSKQAYRNFVLRVEWRLKNEPGRMQFVP